MQQAWLRNQACLPVQLLEPERGCEKVDGEREEYDRYPKYLVANSLAQQRMFITKNILS